MATRMPAMVPARWAPPIVLLAAGVLVSASAAFYARRRRHGPEARDFARRYRRALADPRLANNLLAFQRAWRPARDAAFEELPGEAAFETLRTEMAAAKDAVLADLPHYFARFKAAAEQAGAVVVEAADAEAANAYVADLAARRGARLVIKSKSMVGEETEINHYLGARGLEVVETDLGEWIVQLAGERPSHMVMPAIHKSRQQVGDLFSRVLARPISRESIPEQVGVARTELRRKFLDADIGISGANALIAESGTVMLLTNEGNGRQVTTLPPVHVVLVGYEKLVPTYADAMRQLAPPGPQRHGPAHDQLHDLHYRSGPARQRGPHRLGRQRPPGDARGPHVPRSAPLHPLRGLRQRLPALPGRRRPRLWLHLLGRDWPREHAVPPRPGAGGRPAEPLRELQRLRHRLPGGHPAAAADPRRAGARGRGAGRPAGETAGPRRMVAAGAVRRRLPVAAWVTAPLAGGPFLRRLPLPASWRWRTPPRLARGRPATASPGRANRRGDPDRRSGRGRGSRPAPGVTVACFLQCLTDRFLPEVAEATVDVLQACGARVVIPPAQPCCGLPALDARRPSHGATDGADHHSRARGGGRGLRRDARRELRRGDGTRLSRPVRRRPGLVRAGPAAGDARARPDNISDRRGAAGCRGRRAAAGVIERAADLPSVLPVVERARPGTRRGPCWPMFSAWSYGRWRRPRCAVGSAARRHSSIRPSPARSRRGSWRTSRPRAPRCW